MLAPIKLVVRAYALCDCTSKQLTAELIVYQNASLSSPGFKVQIVRFRPKGIPTTLEVCIIPFSIGRQEWRDRGFQIVSDRDDVQMSVIDAAPNLVLGGAGPVFECHSAAVEILY
ncbi:MAG: hypothetical protein ACYCO5_04855 [Acidobacteriaceae bacterium]